MKRTYLLILSGTIFCFCSAMSKCKFEPAPGPVTTVHGVVTDGITGKPIPNLQLKISDNNIFDGSNRYVLTNTDANGNYYLKFTPYSHTSSYEILPGPNVSDQYGYQNLQHLTLGINNETNVTFFKVVNLTIHLQNISSHNKTQYFFDEESRFYGLFFSISPPKIDTTFTIKASHLSNYTFKSTFLNDTNADTTTVKYVTLAYIGEKDTLVNILNP